STGTRSFRQPGDSRDRLLLRPRGSCSLLLYLVELSRELLEPKEDFLAPLTQACDLMAKIASGRRERLSGFRALRHSAPEARRRRARPREG
ncbi:MAG TPA: hypothetical protein VN971_07345, partial [Thermoanaerobaculia bacterium]|nr:hypothetical protein [Thermoanaerobaculia bacterium]